MNKPSDRFKFERGYLPPEAADWRDHQRKFPEFTEEEAKRAAEHTMRQVIWVSSLYQVNVVEVPTEGLGVITWLSIKRRDKAPLNDWREMQRIKNAIVGEEREGCELYPAESRLVDTSNQYHIWVLPEGMSFPFGYGDREIRTESSGGAVQRPFDEEVEA